MQGLKGLEPDCWWLAAAGLLGEVVSPLAIPGRRDKQRSFRLLCRCCRGGLHLHLSLICVTTSSKTEESAQLGLSGFTVWASADVLLLFVFIFLLKTTDLTGLCQYTSCVSFTTSGLTLALLTQYHPQLASIYPLMTTLLELS